LSLHIVLRHRDAPQGSQNSWLDEHRPLWITTIPEVALRCQEAARRNEPVRIHRAGWAAHKALVCCECTVEAVREIDEHQYHVAFAGQRVLEMPPLVRPVRGQACYQI